MSVRQIKQISVCAYFHSSRAFDRQGRRQNHKKAEDGEHRKHVGRGQVFPQRLAAQHFLAQDGFGRGRDGTQSARVKRQPCERELRQEGQREAN